MYDWIIIKLYSALYFGYSSSMYMHYIFSVAMDGHYQGTEQERRQILPKKSTSRLVGSIQASIVVQELQHSIDLRNKRLFHTNSRHEGTL
jgi:hypothetical protein